MHSEQTACGDNNTVSDSKCEMQTQQITKKMQKISHFSL